MIMVGYVYLIGLTDRKAKKCLINSSLIYLLSGKEGNNLLALSWAGAKRLFSYSSLLDAFFVIAALKNTLYKNARCMNFVGV